MATARRDTAGTGSISEVGCLITGNGCRASNSAAPFQAGAYTVTVPAGSPVASACTNDWMPPRRGGKSLVTIRVRGTGRVYKGGWSCSGAIVGATQATGLRAQDSVEVAGVPRRALRDLLYVHPGLRSVDDVAAAHVDGHVPLAVVDQQVARLDRGKRDVRQRGPLPVAVAGYL